MGHETHKESDECIQKIKNCDIHLTINSSGIDLEMAILRLRNTGMTKSQQTRLRMERYHVPQSRQAEFPLLDPPYLSGEDK